MAVRRIKGLRGYESSSDPVCGSVYLRRGHCGRVAEISSQQAVVVSREIPLVGNCSRGERGGIQIKSAKAKWRKLVVVGFCWIFC